MSGTSLDGISAAAARFTANGASGIDCELLAYRSEPYNAGQGAPLVPIADAMLFSSKTSWRALQNLGGIGNVTVVPPGGVLDKVRAFDTGPGVAVIDGVTRLVRPELPFDVDGKLAAAGTAD